MGSQVVVQDRLSNFPALGQLAVGRLALSGGGDDGSGSTTRGPFQPVQPVRVASAWAAGIGIFNTQLTKDKRKRILLANAIAGPAGLVSAHVTVAAPHSGTNATPFATQLQPLSPLSQLINETQDAAKRCDEKKGAIQKKLELILSTLNRYAQAVDVLIQQHPDTTAFAWGAIRMLVTVAVSDQSTSEQLSTALADIVDSIGRCEDYQNIYPYAERLETIIARLYAEVINFLVRSKKYYETHGAVRVAKGTLTPFETKFGKILGRIEKLRQDVRDEVHFLDAQVQGANVREEIKFRQELISHIGKANHKWLVEEQLREETSTKNREENLRTIRYWLDATHFDHLKREKHWQDGTCEWIMGKAKFCDWLEHGSGPFWIYGIPGCGKTVMATFLQTKLVDIQKIIISFFCKNDEESKRRPQFIISTLISQLLDHPQLAPYQDKVGELITKAYNKHKDISKISMDKLCELLQEVLSTLPPVMIIIDALDECDAENLSRGFLIERLVRISGTIAGTKIIFTSRQDEAFLKPISSCSSIEMSKDDISSDIEAVVRKAVEESPKLSLLKDKVITGLLNGADGMFLWANLMLATLNRARNRNAVEKMLANLPIGLRGVYEHILITIGQKLSEEQLELRKEILSWVTTAARPMTLEELSVALAVEPGASSLDDGEIILKLENDVRDLCGPMLRMSDDRTVQVVHMSLRDMLHGCMESAGGNTQGRKADQKYMVNFLSQKEHNRLASACITYVAFEAFRGDDFISRVLRAPEDLALIAKEHVLLEYAASHWIHHISQSGEDGVDLLSHVLELLQSTNAYIWIQFLNTFVGRRSTNFSVHVLQRSRLLDWAKNVGKLDDPETAQILNNYLIQAVEAGVRLSEVLLGPKHIQTLKTLQSLGCLYDHEDRLEEARSTQQRIIDTTLGITDAEVQPIFKKSCIELAYVYRVKGNYEKSVELLQLVLGGPGPAYWTYDALGAEAMADLGVVYRCQRNLQKAREMAEKGAEGLVATLGPHQLMSIRYIIELCRTYFDCGLYAEAQALLEKILKTADEVLGPEESATLHGRDLLGNILHARGDLNGAEELLREVLRMMEQQWGKRGRSTALLKTHVADVIVDKGELTEAIDLYEGALETYEGLYGVEHPDTQSAATKLANCYSKSGLNNLMETVTVKYRL